MAGMALHRVLKLILLVALTVLLSPYVFNQPSGDSSDPATKDPTITSPVHNYRDYNGHCASREILGTLFQFSFCLNKVKYELGEMVNLNESLTNTAQATVHIAPTFTVEVFKGSKNMFSEWWGCLIPEGCDFAPGQAVSWKWSLALPEGDYVAVGTLLNPPGDPVDCQIDGIILLGCRPLQPITVSIAFTIEASPHSNQSPMATFAF